MTNAKNVYVLLLSLIIVLSGCFGNAADDVDADDDDDEDYDDADNLPPVISNSLTGATAFVTGSDCMTTGVNLEVRHAMTDWDGTIVNAGWDIDLDGTIDYTVTADEGYTTLFMPRDVMIWKNYTDQNGNLDSTYWENSFAFGAQDDSGEWTSSVIYTVSKKVWDEYAGGTWLIDTTPCDSGSTPTGDPTNNSFTADDADAETTSGSDDALISIRWQHAEADLDWSQVIFRLSVGDNTYDCSTGANESCTIGQDGDDDSVWETGEFLMLSESGTDIAGADGATTIDIYVMYNGHIVAGDSSVTVS